MSPETEIPDQTNNQRNREERRSDSAGAASVESTPPHRRVNPGVLLMILVVLGL